MAPHTGSATPEQIGTLLNFLDDHKDLARGRLRSVEGKVQAKRLWEELCNLLNSMGGCTKTVQQWQKVCFDRKHLTKKAAADARRSASATGGGPSTAHQLSHWELKVLSIMGDGFGKRQTGARVPAFSETNEPIPSTSSQVSLPPSFPQPLSLDLPEEIMEYVGPSQDESQPRQPVSQPPPVLQEPVTFRHSSQPTRPRMRQSTGDVRTRLFQFEEGRAERETVRNSELAGINIKLAGMNTKLAGIEAGLSQLCGLIREYIDHRD